MITEGAPVLRRNNISFSSAIVRVVIQIGQVGRVQNKGGVIRGHYNFWIKIDFRSRFHTFLIIIYEFLILSMHSYGKYLQTSIICFDVS